MGAQSSVLLVLVKFSSKWSLSLRFCLLWWHITPPSLTLFLGNTGMTSFIVGTEFPLLGRLEETIFKLMDHRILHNTGVLFNIKFPPVYLVAATKTRKGAGGEAVGCMICSNKQLKRVRKCFFCRLYYKFTRNKKKSPHQLFQWAEVFRVYCKMTARDSPQLSSPGCSGDYQFSRVCS